MTQLQIMIFEHNVVLCNRMKIVRDGFWQYINQMLIIAPSKRRLLRFNVFVQYIILVLRAGLTITFLHYKNTVYKKLLTLSA